MEGGINITRDECIKFDDTFAEVEHSGIKCFVTPTGKVMSWNGKEYIERQWKYNKDGYAVVSISDGIKYRSVGIHVLVAKAWVENPLNKPEVNHLDFDRKNPWAYNLEWVTHQENIEYSSKAGKYKGRFGEDNPNYGNNTLHLRYTQDKDFAKEKQSRPGKQNGRAIPCNLYNSNNELIGKFDYQSEAVDYLKSIGVIEEKYVSCSAIRYLKREQGYKGYYLKSI